MTVKLLVRANYVALTLFVSCASIFAADDPAPTLATHDRWVTALAFSPDGKTLATVGGQSLLYRPGDVQLWEVASGKHVASRA